MFYAVRTNLYSGIDVKNYYEDEKNMIKPDSCIYD